MASRSWCLCKSGACCALHALPELDASRQTFSQLCSWWWHRTTATIKDLEGSQKTVAGPTRGGWASHHGAHGFGQVWAQGVHLKGDGQAGESALLPLQGGYGFYREQFLAYQMGNAKYNSHLQLLKVECASVKQTFPCCVTVSHVSSPPGAHGAVWGSCFSCW